MKLFRSIVMVTIFLMSNLANANPSELQVTEVKELSGAFFKDSWNEEQGKFSRTLTVGYWGGCTKRTLFRLAMLSKKKNSQGLSVKLGIQIFEETRNCRAGKYNEEAVNLDQLLIEQMPVLAQELANGGYMTFEIVPKITLTVNN